MLEFVIFSQNLVISETKRRSKWNVKMFVLKKRGNSRGTSNDKCILKMHHDIFFLLFLRGRGRDLASQHTKPFLLALLWILRLSRWLQITIYTLDSGVWSIF